MTKDSHFSSVSTLAWVSSRSSSMRFKMNSRAYLRTQAAGWCPGHTGAAHSHCCRCPDADRTAPSPHSPPPFPALLPAVPDEPVPLGAAAHGGDGGLDLVRPEGVVVGQLLGASGVVSGHLGVIVCDGTDEGLIVLLYQVVGGGQTLRGLLRILRQLGQSTMTAAIMAENAAKRPADRGRTKRPRCSRTAPRPGHRDRTSAQWKHTAGSPHRCSCAAG